jgi:hypothetical protein
MSTQQEQWVPLSSRDLEFDIYSEMRHAIVDVIRQNEPSSVLGVLMAHADQAITLSQIADQLASPVGEVEWTVEKLEEEDLCERIADDGQIRVVAFAAYSARNALPTSASQRHKEHPSAAMRRAD